MRTSRRRFSDGNLGPVAGKAKAFSKGRGRGRAGGGASAGELGKILEKKGLTHEEIFLIRQTMVQVKCVSQEYPGDDKSGNTPVAIFIRLPLSKVL